MLKYLKKVLLDILIEGLFMFIAITVPVLYYVFIPQHWGTLTLITLPVLCWYGAKLHVKLIK